MDGAFVSMLRVELEESIERLSRAFVWPEGEERGHTTDFRQPMDILLT